MPPYAVYLTQLNETLNSSMPLRGLLRFPKGLYSRSLKPHPLGPSISRPLAVDVHFSEAVMPSMITPSPYSWVPNTSPF
jgi:hypothetical protein